MSYFKKGSVPIAQGDAMPAHLSTGLIKEIDALTEEVEYLRFLLSKADDVLGPASDDIFAAIKSEYIATGKKVPVGY